MGGKILFVILAIFLLFGVFVSPINDGIDSWRAEDTSQGFSVVTGAGATTANVTLTGDLYQDAVTEVTAITSNISGEAPVATTYTTATNVLLISALNPSATHTLTVAYAAERSNSAMRAIGPFLGLLIFGGLVFLIFLGAKGNKKR